MRILSSIAFLVPLVAQAQQPSPTAPQPRDVAARQLASAGSLRGAASMAAEGDTCTALGWDYRASIGANGLRYTPVLGMAAPTTQHLALQLDSVRRGERVLHAVPAQRPLPRCVDAHRAVIAHGDGIDERFDATSDGVELSLAFAQPLPGEGDLIVSYRLDTSLQPGAAGADGASFVLEGVGGVHIGKVSGIAADGASVPGELRQLGDRIELRLPAAFVATAKYPLLLDPLIGTQFLGTPSSSNNDSQPDIAYDVAAAQYGVVYRRVISAVQAEVRAFSMPVAGGPVGIVTGIATAAAIAQPRIVDIQSQNAFVIAWLEAPSPFAFYNLAARSLSAITGGVGNAVTLASGVERFDAAGDNTASGNGAPVVLAQNTGPGTASLQMSRILLAAPLATPQWTGLVPVATPAGTITSVAISKSAPSTAPCAIAWTDVVAGTSSLRVNACDRAGNLLIATRTLDFGPVGNYAPDACDIDGNGVDYLLVYSRNETGTAPAPRDIVGAQLTWNGGALTGPPGLPYIDGVQLTDQMHATVAWCGGKFLVAYASQLLPDTYNYDLKVAELAPDCTSCGQRYTLLGLNGTIQRANEFMPAIGARVGAPNGLDREALLLFTEADDSPPFSSELVGSYYNAFGTGSSATTVGSSCGIAGQIGSDGGPPAFGNTQFRVTLTGAQPTAVPFLLLGFPGGETTCGACVNTVAVSTLFILPNAGSAFYSLPVRCSHAAFLGTTLQAQWLLLGTSANPCPAVPGLGLSATSRLRITVGF